MIALMWAFFQRSSPRHCSCSGSGSCWDNPIGPLGSWKQKLTAELAVNWSGAETEVITKVLYNCARIQALWLTEGSTAPPPVAPYVDTKWRGPDSDTLAFGVYATASVVNTFGSAGISANKRSSVKQKKIATIRPNTKSSIDHLSRTRAVEAEGPRYIQSIRRCRASLCWRVLRYRDGRIVRHSCP
jgi:hypothetical protein